MILYHFTSVLHWPKIITDQYLKVCESEVGSGVPIWKPFGKNIGPAAVWLTSRPELRGEKDHGLCYNGPTGPLPPEYSKRRIRIAVDVHDAHCWPQWAIRQGAHPAWVDHLSQTGGGLGHTWFVVPRPILISEWIEIKDTLLNQTYNPGTFEPIKQHAQH